MKFYEFIESLQRLNPNKIIMIKTGAFFNSIGRDAIILELNGDNITETRKYIEKTQIHILLNKKIMKN